MYSYQSLRLSDGSVDRFSFPQPLNNVSEELAELKEGLSPLVAPHLHRLMFSKECAAHVQAAESIMMALVDHGAALYSNLDRILHWLRLRMSDGNTQCLVKTLDATGAIFADLAASGMQMSDYEASIILPALAERSGHNQDRIRQRHRELLAQASDLLERHVKVLTYFDLLPVLPFQSSNSLTPGVSMTWECRKGCWPVDKQDSRIAVPKAVGDVVFDGRNRACCQDGVNVLKEFDWMIPVLQLLCCSWLMHSLMERDQRTTEPASSASRSWAASLSGTGWQP